MASGITEEEFADLLREFGHSAFRLEAQPAYALSYEQADLAAFRAGSPAPPPDVGWWQDWLAQVTAQVAQGKTVTRVRVLEEPPSDYQRWMIWAGPWYGQAGEQIRYLTRSHAASLGIPLKTDWWMLDDKRLVLMHFSPAGEIAGKELITDAAIVARHRDWRDAAVRSATA
jgi:hypothetical protein